MEMVRATGFFIKRYDVADSDGFCHGHSEHIKRIIQWSKSIRFAGSCPVKS